MAPPICSASDLLIARPSPVPPYLRLMEASTWLNESKIRSWCSGGIPGPVSRTTNEIAVASVFGQARGNRQRHLARAR